MVHRVIGRVKKGNRSQHPSLYEIITVFIAHKLSYIFDALYNFRNFLRKARARLERS
jgi:hypothetical protein